MNDNKNISRDDIANAINKEFGFSRKECLDVVNDIIEIIISGLKTEGKIKIHNIGTFKVKKKKSRIGRNPKTKEEFIIDNRNVITFKISKNILNYINISKDNEEIS